MISAINSLSHTAATTQDKARSNVTIKTKRSPKERKIIRHQRPQFNRSKILEKIQQKTVKDIKKGEAHPGNQAMKIVPPEQGLASSKEDASLTREKLKTLLGSSGAMMFSEKERSVLGQILHK